MKYERTTMDNKKKKLLVPSTWQQDTHHNGHDLCRGTGKHHMQWAEMGTPRVADAQQEWLVHSHQQQRTQHYPVRHKDEDNKSHMHLNGVLLLPSKHNEVKGEIIFETGTIISLLHIHIHPCTLVTDNRDKIIASTWCACMQICTAHAAIEHPCTSTRYCFYWT